MYQCSAACLANSGYWDGKACLNGANPPRIQVECEKGPTQEVRMCDELCENQGGVWANETCTLPNGVKLDVCGKNEVLPEAIRKLLPGRAQAAGSHPQVSPRAAEMANNPREEVTGNTISPQAIEGAATSYSWTTYALLGAGAFLILRLLK
jgi:hypothetical protein